MKRHRRVAPSGRLSSAFAGFRFPPEVILLAVRWYLRFGLSYRDLEEQDRLRCAATFDELASMI
jgi:transposase-like protein